MKRPNIVVVVADKLAPHFTEAYGARSLSRRNWTRWRRGAGEPWGDEQLSGAGRQYMRSQSDWTITESRRRFPPHPRSGG